MENIYKFYIQAKNGDYYYLNSGSVDLTATKTALNYAPQNWDTIQLSWERGFKYYGIVRKTTNTLEFHKDSATILRSLFYNNGVNSYAKFVIEKFNNTLAVQDYEPFYSGEINFVSFRSTMYGVSAEIIEGGFLSKLESRETTNYEIDLYTNPDQIWVKMDGINLQYLAKWIGADSTNDVDIYPNLYFLSDEGQNLHLTIGDQAKNPLINILDNEFIRNDTSLPRTFIMKFDFNYNIIIDSLSGTNLANQPYFFRIMYMIDDFNTLTNYFYSDVFLDTNGLSSGQSGTRLGTNTQSITLQPNTALFVEMEMYSSTHPLGHLSHQYYTLNQIKCEVELSLDNRTPTTYIKCLRPITLFNDLIDKISDNETSSDSSFLDGLHENKVITSFDSIRNLENAKLKTNLKDFFDSINYYLNACLIYDNQNNICQLEAKNYVYDNSTIVVNLGEVKELEIVPFTSELFAKLKSNSNDYTYDSVNGKDEFNTENEFLSPLTATTNEKNMLAPYRTDMYGIELARLNLTNKKVTDNESDNDIAMLHIESSVAGTIPAGFIGEGEDYYELYRDNTLTITNIYSPQTAFNIEFSPLRSILRHGDYLHSLLYGNDSEYIKYQTSKKSNYLGLKMVTDDGVTILNEGANILISTLNDILFKPTLFNFKTKGKINIDSTMNLTPYQLCSFTFKRNTYLGFFIKSSVQPAFNEVQNFSLLCAPQTNLGNLVY